MSGQFLAKLWSNHILEAFKKRNKLVGCDIHVYIEKKTATGWELVDCPGYHEAFTTRPDGEPVDDEGNLVDAKHKYGWEEVRKRFPLTEDRNYTRFARLAGVRNYDDDKEAREPKGWPPDICKPLHQCLNNSDLHSHTHYSVQEAAKIWKDTEDSVGGGLNAFANVAPEVIYFGIDPNTVDLNDYRILIAFDN